MSKVRNHVHVIEKSTGVVRATKELVEKTKAEVIEEDPKNADELIKKNVEKVQAVKKEK
jgi:hypothetical protein